MRKSIFANLLMTVFVLSACKNLEPSQIHAMSSSDLCKETLEPPLKYATNTKDLIAREISKRKLDCTPAHIICTNYGFKRGTKEYGQCRTEQQRIALEVLRMQQEAEYMQEMINKPSPSINCTTIGRTTTCN
jgi:hypothetical protein